MEQYPTPERERSVSFRSAALGAAALATFAALAPTEGYTQEKTETGGHEALIEVENPEVFRDDINFLITEMNKSANTFALETDEVIKDLSTPGIKSMMAKVELAAQVGGWIKRAELMCQKLLQQGNEAEAETLAQTAEAMYAHAEFLKSLVPGTDVTIDEPMQDLRNVMGQKEL